MESLNTAIDGVNGFLDTAGKTQTGLDFHSEYLTNLGAAKTTVGIRIQPGLDRYYYIGVVNDPAGVVDNTDTTVTTGGASTFTNTVTNYHNRISFNVYFAKSYYDFTIRGGLFENSGGLGFDYDMFHDKLRFTFEAFDLKTPNLRSQLQYSFFRGLYVTAGVSDILNQNHRYSNYLGAGLFLTNDDLKMLLLKVPSSMQ